jgi:hypothetical protein
MRSSCGRETARDLHTSPAGLHGFSALERGRRALTVVRAVVGAAAASERQIVMRRKLLSIIAILSALLCALVTFTWAGIAFASSPTDIGSPRSAVPRASPTSRTSVYSIAGPLERLVMDRRYGPTRPVLTETSVTAPC